MKIRTAVIRREVNKLLAIAEGRALSRRSAFARRPASGRLPKPRPKRSRAVSFWRH